MDWPQQGEDKPSPIMDGPGEPIRIMVGATLVVALAGAQNHAYSQYQQRGCLHQTQAIGNG